MSRVRDIVRVGEFFAVEGHQSVAEVARIMADLHVGAILVIDGEELRGVFSERDLMHRVVLQHRDPDQACVREVMTTEVATIDELASIEEAMEAMRTHHCRHLPVIRQGHVVGFLSMRDLMNHELARTTDELHHMLAYIGSSA